MSARARVPKSTIIDIAAASGVSVSTVSRIINNKPDVAERTRERVLRVMDDLGFAPQSAWQQIRSGRTRLILDQLDAGRTSPQQILLRPELLIRESTAMPRSGPIVAPTASASVTTSR